MDDKPSAFEPHLEPIPAEAEWVEDLYQDRLSDSLQRLLQVAPHVRAALARQTDLTATDVEIFEQLMGEPLGPAELARRVHLTTAAASIALDRLEEAGHVTRKAHPDDGRRQMVVPTTSGMASVFSALQPMLIELEKAGEPLTKRQREVVADYLDRVTAALQATIDRD
jgi:DNA-binding MarR family transcriptional regulator